MIWIYILLFVIIALIVYLIYLVRFWGRTNIELTGDTYTGLNNVLCRILNQDCHFVDICILCHHRVDTKVWGFGTLCK